MGQTQPNLWAEEREGRVVRLLQQLCASDSEEDTARLRDELQEATGQELDADPSRWLTWYFEEHLGIRPVIDVLSGRAPQENRRMSAVFLKREDVFARPEYNWCALERIHSRDDMTKLAHLYRDLETPMRADEEGPFCFARLTGLAEEEAEYFRGKTLSEALFSPQVQTRHLRTLKDYGKLMMLSPLPAATQRTGSILYAAAIAQALVRFETKITALSYRSLADTFKGLLDRPYLVESYTKLFEAALDKCA